MKIRNISFSILPAAVALVLAGCAGLPSKHPPLELFWDMNRQPKYKPQAASEFFPDGRSSRRPVAGTVAQGQLNDDDAFYTGVVNNMYVGKNPLPIDQATLTQGRRKFETYCAPCHSRTGSDVGIVGRRVLATGQAWLPTMLQDDRVKKMTDGEIFTVITNGRRSMHGYKYQIAERDRWAIIAYVRALHRSTMGTVADVPAELRSELR
jgi:mono/diheme cytochrome c family protein